MPFLNRVSVLDEDTGVQTNTARGHRIQFLQLPRELIVDIISELRFSDLCALRLTNRELHHLIYDNESTILRQYMGNVLEPLQDIYKPLGPLTLNYFTELIYRARKCSHLSSLLADRCCEKLESRPPPGNKVIWREGKRSKLKDGLALSLFVLYEFLDQFRRVILRSLHEFEAWLTADFAGFGDILCLDQQRIIETFHKESFLHIGSVWQILEGVANSKGVPLSCRSTNYPFASVKVLLVLGGLDRFTALMDKASLKERIEDLDAFNKELWQGPPAEAHPNMALPLLSSIHHLAPPPKPVSSSDFPRNISPTTSIEFINSQRFFDSSLMAVILRSAGTLDVMPQVDQYICTTVKEGDSPYILPSWCMPDDWP